MYTEISNPMDYKTAIYIRLSKEDGSIGESESITNQRSLLNGFAEKHRLSIAAEFIDDGVSGTSFDRPNFNRMIEAILAKQINMVITKDLSRLGRDYIQTGYYLEKFFPENRVRYISLLDGIDTGTAGYNNDITPFKAIMNDMYAKDISQKIRSVKEDKQKKGQFIGGKAAYGYKKSSVEKNKIIIDEEVAPVVRRMFTLAASGVSCYEIAVILNREKITSPAGYAGIMQQTNGMYKGLWSAERVTFMLQNEIYIGNMVQGRVKKINYKSEKILRLPPSEWAVVENTHEAIIDRDTFDIVQTLITKRKKTRERTHNYLLKGLVHCHECGYLLSVINRKLAKGREVLYFVCRTYQRFPSEKKCTVHYARVDSLTDAVLYRVREICERYLNLEEMQSIAKLEVARCDAESRTETDIRELGSKIEFLTSKLDQVYSDKLYGVLSHEDFERIYGKLKEDRENLSVKLKMLKSKSEAKVDNHEKAKELAERFINSIEANKELVFSLIERVELTQDKQIIIYWTFEEMEA